MPWPPTVNTYWRHVGSRVLISEKGKKYKRDIQLLALTWKRPKLLGRLSVHIKAFPPDKRARDLDNLLKVTLDSLQDAGLFENDSQIDEIFIQRKSPLTGGELLIYIEEL